MLTLFILFFPKQLTLGTLKTHIISSLSSFSLLYFTIYWYPKLSSANSPILPPELPKDPPDARLAYGKYFDHTSLQQL